METNPDMNERKVFHACQHDCPDNCAMVSTIVDDKVVSVRGRKEHTFTRGVLCGKVKNYDQRVYSKDRILYPMRRIGEKGIGKFERISWQEALDAIGENFRDVIEKHGAESILPYSYLGHQGLLNGMHCGDSFFNKLGASIGERTFCNATASKAFRMVAGPSGGVDPESFAEADVIIMWGINMLSTSMHHSRFVIEAMNKGAIFVVIDPVRTRTARRAHHHIQPKPGTDVVLAMAIANFLIKENMVDMDYIKNYTLGFDDFAERARQFSLDYAHEVTGVSVQEIKDLALLMVNNKAVAIRTGVALERTANGGDAVRAIASLPALTGSWRLPGGGIFQHPQGTFPINRNALTNAQFVEDSRNSVNLFDLASALSPDAIVPIKSLFVYNANPVIAAANQLKLLENLCRKDLFTVVSEIFQTDTCDYADIVLPATSQMEQKDLMYSWGHYNIQFNHKAIEPLGEAVSNTELFRRLAQVFLFGDDVFTRDDDEIMSKAMFWDHKNLDGITLQSISEQGFARLNVGDPKNRTPHRNGEFPTASGKFEFASSQSKSGGDILNVYRQGVDDKKKYPAVDALPSYKPNAVPDDGFVLISPKHHYFLNSGYANFNLDNEVANKQTVMINTADAEVRGIRQGEKLILWNDLAEVSVFANVTDDVINGVLVVSHGFWRRHVKGNTVNALVHSKPSAIGQGITVNDTVAFIKKHEDTVG